MSATSHQLCEVSFTRAGGEKLELATVDVSLQPLRDHFNLHRDKLRFIAFLSPTCGPCLEGGGAIKEAILDPFPDFNLAVSIVWIDMLKGDSQGHAQAAAKIITDRRARHFHDPQRFAGKAVARVLDGNGKAAWDIYLFYPKEVEWAEAPPLPIAWMHQLTGSRWADAEHYRRGRDLTQALHSTAQKLRDRL